MKKAILSVLLIILLVSCSTSRADDFSSIDPDRAMLILLQAERNALISTENSSLYAGGNITLPEAWTVYSQDLPQFRSLLDDYLTAITDSIDNAMSDVTDYLFTCIDNMEIDDVYAYFESGYSSLTDELRLQHSDEIRNIFLTSLEDSSASIGESWQRLSREARIWRENLLNLELVGQAVEVPVLKSVSTESIADYAVNAYFSTLAGNEIIQRDRLMSST